MKFLVTGGAGFIGSNCIQKLLLTGHKVRVVDNLSTGKYENIVEFIKDIEFIHANIEDENISKRIVKGMDFIIHLAAIPSVQFSVEEPLKANESIITATLSLYKAAVDYGGIKRIVQAVSAAAYGDNPFLPKTENMLPEPLSPYAAAKLAQEYYGITFCNTYGIQITSLRLFNVYGPKQDPRSHYSGVISIFLEKMLANQRPTIYGDGRNTRDFVYVSDIVEALYKACFAEWTGKSEIINIGTGLKTDLNRLIDIINTNLETSIKPYYSEVRIGDILHSVADITKASKILGYKPIVSIEQGIAKLIETNR